MAQSHGNNETKALTADNNPYISCIKIHGLRILPPILTDEKRNRMQYYKELAMKIEEKIKNRKLNNQISSSTDEYNSHSYLESNTTTLTDSISYSSDDEPTTLKSQIFSESCRSDVLKMLNDNHIPAINKVPFNSEESDKNKCLINSETELPEKPNLSNDIEKIDAENEKSSIFVTKQDSPRFETNEIPTNDDSYKKNSPPLLIRSNSYTLDSPSPFLLALIQQNSPISSSEVKLLDSSSKKRRTWDLENAREKWSSIEHDLNVVADKTMGHKRADNFNSLPPSSHTSPEHKMFDSRMENIKRSQFIKRVDSLHLPEKEIEIPISDNSKQIKKNEKNMNNKYNSNFITPTRLRKNESRERIDSPIKKTESQRKTDLHLEKSLSTIQKQQNNQKKEIVLPKKPEIITCEKTELQIREIINKIHSEQSLQMTDLIARQKREQETLMKFFAEQQALVLSQLRRTYLNKENTNTDLSTSVSVVPESDILQTSENVLSECKKILQIETSNLPENQTSVKSPDDTITSDLTLKSCTPSPDNNTSSGFSNPCSVDSLELIFNGNSSQTKKLNRSCSRQLFPTKQQIWAASIINAGVRGYLVRRLIKTERVQNLIKTIRDTLVCAMQLHHETVDKIETADVELHRRLIQQVTAACYSFHDTFFELSRSDQLQIIATDRERQKEKLLRPLSAKSSGALSSTTQKVLERKMRRRSSASDTTSRAASRCSSSRSCYSMGEFRVRTKSLGISDSVQSSRRTSPQNEVIRSAMSYGANKKPWR